MARNLISFALLAWTNSQVFSAPVALPNNLEALRGFTAFLEENAREMDLIAWDDENANRVSGLDIFPGVASVIIGVVTGDLRRLIEDGVFGFLGKRSQGQAIKIFQNLLQVTQPSTTSTTAASTKAAAKSVGTTKAATQPDNDEDGELTGPVVTTPRITRKPTINYKYAYTKVTTVKPTAATTTEGSLDPDEEEELADNFEKALEPFVGSNPDELIPSNIPPFV